LRAEIKEADDKVKFYYQRSNEIFQIYFDTPKAGLQPVAYAWVSEQYAELGDYGKAIRFLDQLERSASLVPAEKAALDRRRSEYRRLLERKSSSEAAKEAEDA
jgi:hypothetical protein